jgi:hypothetical protein
MEPQDVAELSAAIDLQALWAYRLAVGRRTREKVMFFRRKRLLSHRLHKTYAGRRISGV